MATWLMLRRHIPYLLAAAMLTISQSCCPTAPPPPPPAPRLPRVVLVHGIFEQGRNLITLKKRLEKRGFECYVPKMNPRDGRGGLDKLAIRLKQDIDNKFGPDAPISVVGFSMGGIVSREYLQHLGGAKRCETLITVSSPHHGTQLAWLYPTLGAEQMRPGSEFLSNLAKSEPTLDGIKIVSYRSPLDLVIVPPRSSVWDRAENIEYPAVLHPLMLQSYWVVQDVERHLLR
jgi:triacylglycerol lipase